MNINNFYKKKVVLITGSSMGIGKEIARQVLLFGGKVIMTGRNLRKLEKSMAELDDGSGSILIHSGSVTDYENNMLLMEKIVNRYGRLDVLITNAGLSCFGEVERMSSEVAKQVIDTNIYGSLFPVMAALPELKKSEGTVLFISSIAGFYGLPGYSAYCLSKMALKALSQSMSVELKKSNVTVCISFVGFTENDSDKKTLTPGGELVNVKERGKFFISAKKTTGLRILKQIASKKYSSTHSYLGYTIELMSRYFPSLTNIFFRLNYKGVNS